MSFLILSLVYIRKWSNMNLQFCCFELDVRLVSNYWRLVVPFYFLIDVPFHFAIMRLFRTTMHASQSILLV